MCGIVGFVGKQSAAPILLKGLQQLEYRGYDSAGIAVMDAGTICVEKVSGRIARPSPAASASGIPAGRPTARLRT